MEMYNLVPHQSTLVETITSQTKDIEQVYRIDVGQMHAILKEVFPTPYTLHTLTREKDVMYTNKKGMQKRVVSLYTRYIHTFYVNNMETGSYAALDIEMVAVRHPNDAPNTLREVEVKLHFNFTYSDITAINGEKEITLVYKYQDGVANYDKAYPKWTDARIFLTLLHNSAKPRTPFPMGHVPYSFHAQ